MLIRAVVSEERRTVAGAGGSLSVRVDEAKRPTVRRAGSLIEAIRRFLRVLREGPVPVPCRIERLESERGFRLSGDLDVYTVEAVREALRPELHGTLVLDIAAVEFMDDSGLGLLVGSIKRLREQEGSLVLRNPTGQIRRVLEVTGLEQVSGLTIEPDGGSS